MQKKSSPGMDRIYYEILKQIRRRCQIVLLNFYNEIWSQGLLPSDWKDVIITPLLKPNKLQDVPDEPLSEQTLRTVYIKGQDLNLASPSKILPTGYDCKIGKPDQTDCKGNTLCIVCRNEEHKQALLKVSEIDGKRIIVNIPWSLQKRNKSQTDASQIAWNKGVITRVSLDISTEDVKAETGVIWAQRITKRAYNGFVPNAAVIIAFEGDLPPTVTMGFMRHKVSVYIPPAIRCGKCQRYGHKTHQCT